MTKKEKIQIVITSVLGLFFIFAVVDLLTGKEKKVSRPLQAGISQTVNPDLPQASPQGVYAKLEKAAKDLMLERDPFFEVTVQKGPDLNGISWDQDQPVAVINNNIVEVGQRFDGFTVIEIKEKSVILYDGVRNIELFLNR